MIEERSSQGIWNFFFGLFFLVLIYLASIILIKVNGSLPTSVNFFDFVLMVLATMRLTRMVVYDKIMKFFRDWFLDERELISSSGDVLFFRDKPIDGPRRTMADLLSCPWCTGVWFAFAVVFFYFLTPYSWFVILALAVGALASFIQVLANMIGWRAEYLKQQTNK